MSGVSSYGGRGGKASARHCSIAGYLADHHPDLAEAIDRLCMGRFLTPGGPVGGVTFLIPTRSVAADIVKMSEGEDADNAVTLLEAHIVPACFKEAEDWATRGASEAGNRLGRGFGAGVVRSKSVAFPDAGGFEIAPTSFKALRPPTGVSVGPVAVWQVTKESPPGESEGVAGYRPPARPPRGPPRGDGPSRGGGRARFGGADPPSTASSIAWRSRHADQLFEEYAKAAQEGQTASKAPFLSRAVSLLNHLKTNHPGLYYQIWPLLDPDPMVTLLLLLEPYKTVIDTSEGSTTNYLIAPHILHGSTEGAPVDGGADDDGDSGAGIDGGPPAETTVTIVVPWEGAEAVIPGGSSLADAYLSHLDKPPERIEGIEEPKLYSDPETFRSQVDVLRAQLVQNQDLPTAAKRAYSDFGDAGDKRNYIGAFGPVLPRVLSNHVDGTRLLWIDQFRVRVRDLHREVICAHRSDAAAAVGPLKYVVQLLMPGNDYAKEQCLEMIKGSCCRSEVLRGWMDLIYSTTFMGFSIPAPLIGSAWDPRVVAGAGEGIYNGAYEALVLGGSEGTRRGRSHLSPKAMSELAQFVSGGGTLADLGM